MLVVKARQPKPFFAAGNTFEMTCKVSSKNIKSPRYSVLITAEKPVGDLSSPNETKYIISLDQDSVVKLENWTDASRVDGVVLEKVQEDEFRYRMYQTQVSDAGLYRCLVTAWSPVRGSLWREAATSLSNPIEIDFQTSGEQGAQPVGAGRARRGPGVSIRWLHLFSQPDRDVIRRPYSVPI